MKLNYLFFPFINIDKENERLLSQLKQYRKIFMRMEVKVLC